VAHLAPGAGLIFGHEAGFFSWEVVQVGDGLVKLFLGKNLVLSLN
jgi:hypothetical protein